MSTLICPVSRYVATDTGTTMVLCELVNWAGVALILHGTLASGRGILGVPEWTCSHERTGLMIGRGSTPEAALAAAITKLRLNFATFRDRAAELPIVNP